MTKTEILEKIDKGLRGQGNQVDIGGVLADVLDGIVESTPEGESVLTLAYWGEDGQGTKAQAASAMGITEAQVADLYSGKYQRIKIVYDDREPNNYRILQLVETHISEEQHFIHEFIYGGIDSNDNGAQVTLTQGEEGDSYAWSYNEPNMG